MKGTIIVNQRDLENSPGIEQSLLQLSEASEREGDNILFFSREGVLMTMICELLDKEVKYTLQFDANKSQPINAPVNVRARNH